MKLKDKILLILLPFLLFAGYFWLFYYIIGQKKNLIIAIFFSIFLVISNWIKIYNEIIKKIKNK